jgi:hypothetical protein
MVTADAPQPPDGPPGLTLRGPWVVAATLSLFVIVPLISVMMFRLVDAPADAAADPPLVYAERADWPRSQFTVFKSLERGQMSSARTNRVHHENLGLQVTPEHYLAMQRLADIARQEQAAFANPATRDAIQQELSQQPDLFYGHYLLGLWSRLNQRPAAETDAHFGRAFRHAPAALIRHHVTAGGTSAGGVEVPDLALIADRIVDDRRDPTLVLVYPFLQSGPDGYVYVPVYKAILRHAEPTPLPGLADAERKPQWFSFFGRVGRLPDVTVPAD